MAEMMTPGYYLYGIGENQTTLYINGDKPPVKYRFDEPDTWVEVGEIGTLYDRWFNGDVDGPFDDPPAGVPPAP